MGLFQKSVLKSYLSVLDGGNVDAAYQEYKNFFYNPVTQQNIRNAKEEQFQEGFLRELFVKIMGYTINPDPGYNLTTEQKNISDSKKADGAIIINDIITGVIELKGTNTIDLGKVQQQAFYYLSAHPEAVYVITSNFEKLRFYIQKSNEYEEFNLFMLSQDEFKLLYLCISHQSISTGLPLKIKQESVVKEENITKQLYKDYSSFKHDLFRSLCDRNPEIDKLTLFKATQKLIDRFLFVFFCEDNNGLLPANSISEIIKHWNKLREMDEYRPLYDIFKKYFEYINSGRTAAGDKQEIFAYNGGLFSTDLLLDQLTIDDHILYTHTQKLSTYDFISEVDVNILGHIFEHSLNEIEEIQAELEGNPVDKSKTKRKKDGVFYTPKYITEYIVENTVGKLCTDKKTTLYIDEDKFVKAKKTSDRQPLFEKLNQYKQYVLSLTICDPACGSGAFLNQAYVYLQKEHQYIADLESKLFDAPITITDVSADILENNLFGVDINEESVEIARLALWLRSAKKGRKLNNLSNNIKCGNSLIDDPEVAGDKAFKWEEEFPQVFAKGGFDVVIGNPPYVLCQPSNTNNNILEYYKSYEVASYKIDLFHLFYERGINLLKNDGLLGFITPNTFLTNKYLQKLRNFILKNTFINLLVNYNEVVFDDAGVDVATIILTKGFSYNKEIQIYHSINESARFKLFKSQIEWDGDNVQAFNLDTVQKINFDDYKPLGEIATVTFGLQTKDKETYVSNYKKDLDWEQCYTGKDVNRYMLAGPNLYFKNKFSEVKAGGSWDMEIHKSNKIVVRQIGNPDPIFAYDSKGCCTLNTMYSIRIINTSFDYYYLLSILNSLFIKSYWQSRFSDNKELFPKVKGYQLKQIPIPDITNTDQLPFIELAVKMLELHKELYNTQSKFISRIQSNFQLENIPGKLEKFYDHDFKTFMGELKKQKVVLSLKDQDEWDDYFNSYKHDINTLQTEIAKTDREIDQMVYELYELTEEEIAVVENG